MREQAIHDAVEALNALSPLIEPSKTLSELFMVIDGQREQGLQWAIAILRTLGAVLSQCDELMDQLGEHLGQALGEASPASQSYERDYKFRQSARSRRCAKFDPTNMSASSSAIEG